MKHLLALALRSLWARPLRTALTTFGVVLGVAVILAMSITNHSTLLALTEVFSEASGKAQLVINRSDTRDEGFPQEILQRIEGVPGVQAAVPVLRTSAVLADDDSPEQVDLSIFGATSGGLAIYGVDPLLDARVRVYKIVAGTFLSADPDAYDIVLVQEYADTNEIAVGNEIVLLTPGGTARVRVVGLMAKEGPGQLNNGAFGVMPLEATQEITARAGDLDQVDIVSEAEVDLDHLKAVLQTRLGAKYLVTYPAAQGKRVTQMLQGYQMGLNMFSAIAVFVGAFLIYNAFSMTVVERVREIGMLRTLGMTRGQVTRQIMVEAGVLGTVGALLGAGAGILLARGLIRAMELVTAQEVQAVRVPLTGLIMSLIVGVVVTLAAAAIPAWQAGRISPLEALRVRGSSKEGWLVRRGWIAGLALLVLANLMFLAPFPPALQDGMRDMAVMNLLLGGTLLVPGTVSLWERASRPAVRRIYGREGELGARNVERARLRTTLTAAALMIGVAMILSIQSVTGAFGQDISAWITKYIGGDMYVHSTLPMRADLGRRLAQVEGVADVTPVRYLDIRWIKPEGGDEPLAFMAVEPATYRQVTSFVFSGEQEEPEQQIDRLAAGDAIFVSSVLSEKYNLQPGDTLRLATRRGQRDFAVAGVVVDFYNQGMVVQGSWRDLRRYFGINDVSAFLVKAQEGQSLRALQERLDEAYGRTYRLTIESNEAIRSRALGLITQTTGLFDVLALISMVVAALGVINTLTMNVLERTREIGMLRSLGMTRWQVGKMILAEAGMLGLIGGLFGLVFGIFMSRTVLSSINRFAGYKLSYVMPTSAIFVGLIIALVISQLAALWPARRAARLRIVEAIQCE